MTFASTSVLVLLEILKAVMHLCLVVDPGCAESEMCLCIRGMVCHMFGIADRTAWPHHTAMIVSLPSRKSQINAIQEMRDSMICLSLTLTLRWRHRKQPVLKRPGNTISTAVVSEWISADAVDSSEKARVSKGSC